MKNNGRKSTRKIGGRRGVHEDPGKETIHGKKGKRSAAVEVEESPQERMGFKGLQPIHDPNSEDHERIGGAEMAIQGKVMKTPEKELVRPTAVEEVCRLRSDGEIGKEKNNSTSNCMISSTPVYSQRSKSLNQPLSIQNQATSNNLNNNNIIVNKNTIGPFEPTPFLAAGYSDGEWSVSSGEKRRRKSNSTAVTTSVKLVTANIGNNNEKIEIINRPTRKNLNMNLRKSTINLKKKTEKKNKKNVNENIYLRNRVFNRNIGNSVTEAVLRNGKVFSNNSSISAEDGGANAKNGDAELAEKTLNSVEKAIGGEAINSVTEAVM